MTRPFASGQKVYFHSTVHAKTNPSLGASTILVNQGATGRVVDYSHEGTEENLEDDFVGVEIIEGDEAVGKTVWVGYNEFDKISRA